MNTSDLLLVGGAIGLLYLVHKNNQQRQTIAQPHTNTTITQPVTTQPVTNGGGIVGGGGGGYEVGGGGGGIYYGSRYNPAQAAWDFWNWVASIPVNQYEQVTGVIDASQYQ